MDIRYQIKSNFSKTLAVLALAVGITNAIDRPAAAIEENSIKLAQVGIRSRIDSPVPLNLRPRTHTPLPSSNYYRPRREYRGYDRNYGYYGHHGEHHDHHHHHTHRDRYEHRRYNTHRKRRSSRGKVIIFNAPGNLRGYGDRNSYIRVIGK